MQDVEAWYVIKQDKKPTLDKLVVLLNEEIESRYGSPELQDVKEALLDAFPSRITLNKWRSLKGWDDAVWAKARSGPTGMFSHDKRARIIHSLYETATTGNVNAAKIWLTLSGDFVEKMETKNEVVDQFREINKIIHGSKKENV